VAAGAVREAEGLGVARVRVTLLGRFAIQLGERSAGPWYRPNLYNMGANIGNVGAHTRVLD
jgi:hypothetical protein